MSATHSDVRNCHQAAVTLLEDNQSAISMTKNARFHVQSKQISIKYHYIWDQVDKGTVKLKYCRDDYDMMTKGLSKEQFTKLRSMAGVTTFKDSFLAASEEECWNRTLLPEVH